MEAQAALATAMNLPVPTKVSDSELVLRARGGELAACDELAVRYRQQAFLLALHLLGNREDAMDVAQDSMLRFFCHLDRFDPERAVKPWLCSIVRNLVRDLARRQKVRQADSLERRQEELGMVIRDHGPGPERLTARRQLAGKVWAALGELGEDQRAIIVLRDYNDLSYTEISEALGVPMGTVMSRLHRARKQLRSVLKERFDLDGAVCHD